MLNERESGREPEKGGETAPTSNGLRLSFFVF